MYEGLWGEYLNKLESHIQWNPILLNLQYYHSLLNYNHSKLYRVYRGKQSFFSRTIFQPLREETAKYHSVVSFVSILNVHFFKMMIL